MGAVAMAVNGKPVSNVVMEIQDDNQEKGMSFMEASRGLFTKLSGIYASMYNQCKADYISGESYASEADFVEGMKNRCFGDFVKEDPDINSEEPSKEIRQVYIDIHGSMMDDILIDDLAEAKKVEKVTIDPVTIDGTKKEYTADEKIVNAAVKKDGVKCVNKDYVFHISHNRSSFVHDVTISDPKGATIGSYQIDPGYIIPGKVSVFVPLANGMFHFVPLEEHDILKKVFINHEPVSAEDISKIQAKYYLPNQEVYKYIDISKIRISSLSTDDKHILSDNLTKICDITKTYHEGSEGARYRFTKFKNVNNFNLISDNGVTYPYASWNGMHSNVIDNTSIKVENGNIELRNQSGAVIFTTNAQ